MVGSVGELIARLNDPSGDGEEAKFELIGRGVDGVPALAGRLRNLERFGRLTAIEAFEAGFCGCPIWAGSDRASVVSTRVGPMMSGCDLALG